MKRPASVADLQEDTAAEKHAKNPGSRAANSAMLSFLHKGSKSLDLAHSGQCGQALQAYQAMTPEEKKQAIADFFSAGGRSKGLSKLLVQTKESESSANRDAHKKWLTPRGIARHFDVADLATRPCQCLPQTQTTIPDQCRQHLPSQTMQPAPPIDPVKADRVVFKGSLTSPPGPELQKVGECYKRMQGQRPHRFAL